MHPPCEEQRWLIGIYKAAVEYYAAAVNDIQRKLGGTSKDEYERLLEISERARGDSENARLALERHNQEHGC